MLLFICKLTNLVTIHTNLFIQRIFLKPRTETLGTKNSTLKPLFTNKINQDVCISKQHNTIM